MYRNIILLVVIYGSEVWSLKLREERRLRVFENRVLRGIFGPKRDELTREWRILHNEKLNGSYTSPYTFGMMYSRGMRWVGHVERRGRGEAYTGFWLGNLRKRDHLGYTSVDWTII